jgi:predicted ATPase
VKLRVRSRIAGRDRELELVSHLVSDLKRGQGAVLLIQGEAGIGKTCLVQSLIDDARSAGVIVHRGEAHPFERTRPFGVVADALELRRHSSDSRRAHVGSLLIGDIEHSGTPGALPDLRHRVVEEILELVEVECAQAPVLVVLEDLHWANTSTLLALRSMALRLVHVPLLLVGSLRPAPRSTELDLLVAEALRWNAHLVRLEPLEPDEVGALARQELELPPGPALRAVLAKAGGNPLWVVEMIRSLSAEGRLRRDQNVVDVTTSELPDSLRELVVRRLRYLPETTLDLLQITAVLGDAVSINDLASVARRPTTELIGGLREAFDAGLLGEQGDSVVFRHQLVHDAIYHDVPLPVRRALHRDAAGALARSGAEALRIADHLVLPGRF